MEDSESDCKGKEKREKLNLQSLINLGDELNLEEPWC